MLIANPSIELSRVTATPPLSRDRVGIVAALPAEGQCLSRQKLYPGSHISLSGALQLQLAGIGPERAYRAAKRLLATGANALVSWGVAGGLAPHLKAGTLLLPESVQTAGGQAYRTDPRWRYALIHHLNGSLPLSCGALYQAKTILSSPQEKAHLHQQTGCVAVDMESAAVAKLAAEAQIPFIIIRAIADPAQAALPASALRALDLDGRPQPFALMASLLRHPQDLFSLCQLGRYFQAARNTLRALATRAGPTLLAP